MKLKVIVDYHHTFHLSENLEQLGDGIIEATEEELEHWSNIFKSFYNIQDIIGEKVYKK